jgi:hypothetical protein
MRFFLTIAAISAIATCIVRPSWSAEPYTYYPPPYVMSENQRYAVPSAAQPVAAPPQGAAAHTPQASLKAESDFNTGWKAEVMKLDF